MKPAWDQLGDEFADSSSVLIGDADCTASGSDLCNKNEVRGYPTIKYFIQGEDAQDYQGGRDFDSLKSFVEDKLQKLCSVEDTKDCTDKEIKFIEKNKGKSADDVKKSLTRLEGMKGQKMAPDLKKWLLQRINILKQL